MLSDNKTMIYRNNGIKNSIINNIINNHPNIIRTFIDKYNTLSDDVKQLVNFSKSLQDTISSLQNIVSNVKSEYNQLHMKYYECKKKLTAAETRLEQVSNTIIESDNICIICMTNSRECVYVNCGHVCACVECCERMETQCPICRQNGNFVKLIRV